jgi:hypothetical protein
MACHSSLQTPGMNPRGAARTVLATGIRIVLPSTAHVVEHPHLEQQEYLDVPYGCPISGLQASIGRNQLFLLRLLHLMVADLFGSRFSSRMAAIRVTSLV